MPDGAERPLEQVRAVLLPEKAPDKRAVRADGVDADGALLLWVGIAAGVAGRGQGVRERLQRLSCR